MVTGHVFIATSLDGFIAREDGGIDWLESVSHAGEDHGYAAFMASMDGIVMGRATYEKVLDFDAWPYERPVIVLSRSLSETDVPAALSGRVQIACCGPEELHAQLHLKGWSRVYIDGGQVIQSFLQAGLIEDITISRVPVVLGSGRPLFGPLSHQLRFDHIETRAFPSGLVQSKYRVLRDA